MNPDLLNPLPHDPIALITERFGVCLLIGAHARDHVVVTKAGLQGSRLTRDLDFAVAVPSLEVYSEKTAALESSTGVATRCWNGTNSTLMRSAPTSLVKLRRGICPSRRNRF